MKTAQLAAQVSGWRKLFLHPAAWLVLSSLTVSGCAKIREAAFGPGEADDLFTISELQTADIILEEVESGAENRESTRCTAETHQDPVRPLRAPSRLEGLLEDLQVSHGDQSQFPLRFTLDSRSLTAWRLVQDETRLSVLEQSLVQVVEGQKRLPLFQVPVRGFGTVERLKNELGEETTRLVLRDSDWSKATHVRIGVHASDRVAVALPSEVQDELFSRDRLERHITRASDLTEELGVVLAFSDPEAMVQTRINGSELQVWEVTSRSELDPELSRRLSGRRGEHESVRSCANELPESARSSLRDAERDCVLVLRYTVNMTPVRARVLQDDAGRWSGSVQLGSQTTRDARYFRIAEGTVARREHVDPQALSLAAPNVLRVSDLKDQEFFLRTMLTDVPNLFPGVFPGAASDIDRVHFEFHENRVDVVRAQALVVRDRTTRADLETLMSFPASYWRVVERDSQGARLSQPRFERGRHSDANVRVEIDFGRNTIPRLDSPLNWMGVEECLGGAAFTTITNVDSQVDAGRLGFTLQKTFVDGLGSRGCYAGTDLYRLTGQIQTHFTFSERVSFEKAPAVATQYLVELPVNAQRRLGFGFFTQARVNPNSAGNYGRHGSVIEGPSILDIREGKKVTYILAGIPSVDDDRELRAGLIDATRQVVRDWNSAFAQALEGTERGSQGDVLELLVEGEDDREIQRRGLEGSVGDIHRNEIRWFDRASQTGVIGIGGPHSDPRTGGLKSGAVNMYGGNIRAAAESMQRMAQAEMNREAAIARAISNPLAMNASESEPSDTTALAASSVESRVMGRASSGSARAAFDRQLIRSRYQEPARDALWSALEQTIRTQSVSRAQGVASRSSVSELADQWAQSLLTGGVLSGESAQALRQSLAQNARNQVAANALQTRKQCAFDAAASLASSRALLQKSAKELIVAMYRSTLAHELGHNVGLRHNFMGSFDQENWKFDEQDSSSRTYSSIMDYLTDDHSTYDGLGPHDVAAIRLAYTGRVALEDGTLVSLVDYLARVGARQLSDLNASHLAQVPVKKYQFCTDEHVGDDPRCRRHDAGTSPRGIVEFLRKSTLDTYMLTHFGGDRILFDSSSLPGFFRGRIGTYLSVRQFIDEWKRVSLTSRDDLEKSEWRDAARVASEFLHEVVRTPDVMELSNPLSQILAIRDSSGKNLLFEPRIFDDIGIEDETGERLFVRGWKHDKIAALLVLMLRNYGHPRYQRAGNQLSPIEFELESGLFEIDGKAGSPTLALARDILEDRFTPVFVKNPELPVRRSLVSIGGGLASAGPSGALLYPIVIGGLVELDSAGSELTGDGVVDLSRTFRVGAAYRPEAGLVSVALSGSTTPVAGERRHFGLAGSDIGARLVGLVQGKDEVLKFMQTDDVASDPSRILAELMELSVIERASLTPEQGVRMAELFQGLTRRVNALPDTVGPKNLSQLIRIRAGLLEEVTAIAPSSDGGRSMGEEERMQKFQEIFSQLLDVLDSAPLVGVVWNSIDFAALGYPSLYQVDARDLLIGRRAQLFRRVEILSDVLYQVHPELF